MFHVELCGKLMGGNDNKKQHPQWMFVGYINVCSAVRGESWNADDCVFFCNLWKKWWSSRIQPHFSVYLCTRNSAEKKGKL